MPLQVVLGPPDAISEHAASSCIHVWHQDLVLHLSMTFIAAKQFLDMVRPAFNQIQAAVHFNKNWMAC